MEALSRETQGRRVRCSAHVAVSPWWGRQWKTHRAFRSRCLPRRGPTNRGGDQRPDLEDGDDGCNGGRVVRRKKVERETIEGGGGTGKRQKAREVAVDPGTGIEYFTDEAYEIERLLDKKIAEEEAGQLPAD